MIILSCDHNGFEYMQKLMQYLKQNKKQFKYMGPASFNADDDYPDFIAPASLEVVKNKNNMGIFLCGSGIGVNMVANRQKGIRAVCANDVNSAYWARHDDDANVLCCGARFISYRKLLKILNVFTTTKFEGGRHIRRINKF